MVKVIVVRQWGADCLTKSRYWYSWYLDNIIADGQGDIRTRVRSYFRGDVRDAYVVPDTATAEDIALEYNGLWAERVRYLAACIALGEEPDTDGGQGARVIPDPAPIQPGGQALTLDSLVAP
jgi:hypothetical protein